VTTTIARAALLSIAACAHAPDLPLRPDPAPPIGSATEVFTAPDGTQLLARHWATTDVAPRGVVVIVHGLKDHSARYTAFARRLAADGYSVYAQDLRGHGRSAGPRVAPARWLDYVADQDRFVTAIEGREPGRPVFVIGHSMGGAIAASLAIAHRPAIAGVVLSAPALAIDAPPLLLAATRLSGFTTPRFPALDLKNDRFSSDPAAAAQLAADPLVHQPKAPARTAAGLVDGIRQIWARVDQLRVPVLALHGTDDQLTAPSGSRALIRAATSAPDRALRIYDGLAHDLLHEPRGQQVADDIAAWLDAHTGGTAVAAPAIPDRSLRGDPRGWAQAASMAGGVALADGDVGFAGEFAFRLSRGKTVAWHGGVAARIAGAYKSAALSPAGLAVRLGDGVVGVAGGAAIVSGVHFAIPVSLWFEVPLGPAHVGLEAELAYRIGGDPARDGFASSDLAFAGLALRHGADRSYWPRAVAGVGPQVVVGVTEIGGVRAWVVTGGLQLYGAD
jgi:alpha-beta hydrolase superfamily lysophospholipase